jgi:hypothetical protein
MNRRAWTIAAAIVALLVAGSLLAVWLGGGSGDSGTTTLEVTTS